MCVSATQFSSNEFDCAYPPGIERHFWTVARCQIVADALDSLPDRGGRILEIGCGRGIVVAKLRDQSFDCFGVELADAQVPPSVARFVTTATDARQLPAEFRAEVRTVLLLDVIEHLADPAALISQIVEYYPSIHHLIATVPARRELWSNYDEFYRHYRRYDLTGLRETLARAGLKLVHVAYFFHLLYPLMLLAKLGKSRAIKLKPPGRWASLLHKGFAQILYWDSTLLAGALYGTSAIAVAKKDLG
jgi:SAM-dependent methyltransferase